MLFYLAINRLWKQKTEKIYVPREKEKEKRTIVAVLKPPLKAILEKYKNAYSGGLKLLV